MRRYANTDLHLLKGFLVPHDDAGGDFWWRLMKSILRFLEEAEAVFNHANKLLVVETSRGRNDQVCRGKITGRVVSQNRLFEATHGVFGAENGLSEWMVFPKILRKDLVHEVIGIVLVHFDLFEDDAAFARDIVGIEDGVENEIAQHIERDRHVLIEHLDVEADALFGGESVHVAA